MALEKWEPMKGIEEFFDRYALDDLARRSLLSGAGAGGMSCNAA